MRWTMIHAIAAGAAVICFAQFASPVRASDGDLDRPPADEPLAPLVELQHGPNTDATIEETPAFVWSSDLALTPPPYVTTAAAESAVATPSASATVIPLPPGAWTGFASLAGLGTIAFLRHLRRAQ